MPAGSWRARQAWLKKTTRSRPVASATSSSTREGGRARPRPLDAGTERTEATSARTLTFSPPVTRSTVTMRVPSTYRRG